MSVLESLQGQKCPLLSIPTTKLASPLGPYYIEKSGSQGNQTNAYSNLNNKKNRFNMKNEITIIMSIIRLQNNQTRLFKRSKNNIYMRAKIKLSLKKLRPYFAAKIVLLLWARFERFSHFTQMHEIIIRAEFVFAQENLCSFQQQVE